ncbi:hypothetical protein OAory_01055210 [Aspergillus oryzae]|uniref:Uncharacterized protein n=1 Tax=Aspergillus oryzae TaxID=5062 RepID=A0A1S9DKX7_ASPOZ|nr:uncharacterized protein G4B84_003983 [Aspergillus flavus NRRL3357]OOO09713.1 hypothetical protein OAory_01055210 [Aspergillus oryzae]QMW28694.1 hypothetical protein G4B84_003983 [Aspergillus flavus NRRL3357]
MNSVLVLAWEALTRVLEGLVEDIITIIMVVGDLVWVWVVVMGIMDIMGVWVDLGLVGIMEVGLVDTMEDIMVEEGLVGIMVVDIMEGAGDLFLLTGRFMCLYGFNDIC